MACCFRFLLLQIDLMHFLVKIPTENTVGKYSVAAYTFAAL